MLIFIDESGIHKKDGQSTTALVYVEVEHVDKVNQAVLNVETKLNIRPFHWAEHGWKIRKSFLELILREDFTVKIFIFRNPFSQEKWENSLKQLLTEKCVRNIIIDGDKPQRTVLHLKKILRDFGISVKKMRMGNDKAFPCLRLADLFAGLARAHFDDKSKDEAAKLYNIAKIKITTQLGGQDSAG
ncbi:MAG: DUF3800 domain-containing protein [Candidatus Doudnabacteria bacterium]|nr:DUF3800 domain-containing protein [Candidatus Doudnabacteria bacterium]